MVSENKQLAQFDVPTTYFILLMPVIVAVISRHFLKGNLAETALTYVNDQECKVMHSVTYEPADPDTRTGFNPAL